MMASSLARPHFSASSTWIASAFSGLGELLPGAACPSFAGAVIPWIVALSMHGSSENVAAYEANCRRLLSRYGTERALEDALGFIGQASSISSLIDRTGQLEQEKCRPRNGFARVLTPNRYSQDYLPPDAGRARAASKEIFRLREDSASRDGGRVALALATYISMLTVHPLVDGNGRTARALFVADATTIGAGVSSFALAAILLKTSRSAEFHMSAKCARAGDFCMLAECFRSALDCIAFSVHPILRELAAVPVANFESQFALARELHGMLCGHAAQGVGTSGTFA
ncbi:MAG TPA: hypothetical protein DCP40_01305 [Stenotrophomonas sp.]|nr:hypothetical protein [Stenotrophomonas sp.]